MRAADIYRIPGCLAPTRGGPCVTWFLLEILPPSRKTDLLPPCGIKTLGPLIVSPSSLRQEFDPFTDADVKLVVSSELSTITLWTQTSVYVSLVVSPEPSTTASVLSTFCLCLERTQGTLTRFDIRPWHLRMFR